MSTEEKPANNGQPWTYDLEKYLLDELKDNKSYESIAIDMKRTKGSITSRLNLIGYKMYLRGKSIDDILEITRLDEYSLRKTIQTRQTNKDKKKTEISLQTINSEIICIKNEIQSMKSSINELTDMIKAIYEFEI
jgi:hypothetical protein